MSELISGTGKMSTPIKLFNSKPGRGISQSQDTPKRTVWADLYLAGIKTQTSMLAVNKSAEYVAEIWKKSYQNESHAVIDGVTYKVESVLPAKDKLRIKLLLARK